MTTTIIREVGSVLKVVDHSTTVRVINRPHVVKVAIGQRGAQGDPGPDNLFVQNAAPVTEEPTYLWVQTGLGADGKGVTFWIEDGSP